MPKAFVPKNRKPKFELSLKIIDLNNVPLVAGTSCVKWNLPSSISAEHRGRTEKAIIKDHKASWDYEKHIPVRMTVDKSGRLQETEIHCEVWQEYSTSSKGIQLGFVKLNLAEYVDKEDDEDAVGITRRYLMQQSKVNSTLKLGIAMRQVEGDKNYEAPPLKTAMVFGGIAGIVTSEPGEIEDGNYITSITSKTRELSELQDMYRRTLAASWACMSGELAPDKLIEDIFAGGDGGLMGPPSHPHRKRPDDGDDSDADSRRTVRLLHPDSANRHPSQMSGHQRSSSKSSSVDIPAGSSSGTVSGRGSIEQQMQHSRKKDIGQSDDRETTEFDVRDDLRSWFIEARS